MLDDLKLNDNLDNNFSCNNDNANSGCNENKTNSDYSKYLGHAYLSLYL